MKKEERIQKQKLRLAEMKLPEQKLHEAGYQYIAGVDEVGRGPLAGPVVTAAVVLPEDFDVLGVDDSKKLSEKRREELFDRINEKALAIGIGMCTHEEIDEVNILQATKKAMKKAIAQCDSKLANLQPAGPEGPAQIDYVLFDAVTIEDLEQPQEAIIKGDAKVLAIAAASIIAKVTRDRMMVEYAKEYPWYAFEKNKGYGTAAHYEGLREHGTCPIHRLTFLQKGFEDGRITKG
ncbi:MAG: ribonuclease HII [Bacillota bacterium]|nr:ribonuclease HII [Bacillota bacterium]